MKPVAAQPKKSTRKTTKKAPAASKPKAAKTSKAKKTVTKPVTKPEPVKKLSVAAAPAEDNSVDPPAKQISVSASERLKQLAAATRIQKTPEQADEQLSLIHI